MSNVIDRPRFAIDASAPPERRLVGLSAELRRAGRELISRVYPRPEPELLPLADHVHELTGGRFADEIRAWAEALGIDAHELTLANVSYDLLSAQLGCSTMALATADGPVLARNMDWWPEDALARASVVLTYAVDGAVALAAAGWPGMVGTVTGWSARGFAVAMNAVSGLEPADPRGCPTLLHLRRVLEDGADFADAVRLLARERIASSALFIAVGRGNGERVVVERTPTRHALRRPRGDEPLICTNDYRALASAQADSDLELFRTTCSRHDAVQAGCRRFTADGPVTDENLLAILAEPPVAQGITAQHVIVRPAAGTVRLLVPARFLV